MTVIGLTACAAETASERTIRPVIKPGEYGSPSCFLRQTVFDFEVLDDRNLVVFSPDRSGAYLVQVSPPVHDLRFATVAVFQSASARVCGYAGDALVIDRASRDRQRISITGVYRLDEAALASVEQRFGKGPPREKPAPQAGEGARMERELDQQPPR